MSQALRKRKEIKTERDMTSGAGMGASIGEIEVRQVELISRASADESKATRDINASVSITIDYDAGYSIKGRYGYVMADVTSTLPYIDSKRVDFDLCHRGEEDDDSVRWQVTVNNPNILDEIESVSPLHQNPSETTFNIYEDTALFMVGHLDCHNIRDENDVFNSQFVQSVDKKVREAITEFIIKKSL